MRKRLTAVALAGTVGLGAVGASALAYPALADNSKKESPQVKPGAAEQQAAQARRTAAIREALKGLVDDKTLTAAQADKVASTLGGADGLRDGGRRGFDGPGRPGPNGGPGKPGFRPGGGLLGVEGPEADAAAAKVLGLSVDDLKAALRSGSTLADLAKKQGKDVDILVGALVTAAKDRLAAGVKAGRISQGVATQIEKTLEQRVRIVVQNGHAGFGAMGGRSWQGSAPRPPGTAPKPGAPGDAPRPVAPGNAPKPGPIGPANSSSFGTA